MRVSNGGQVKPKPCQDENQFARVPPNSVQAEQSVLGSLLIENKTWDFVADKVSADDFYDPVHRLIFSAIQRLIESEKPVDVVTVSEYLGSNNDLDTVGGLAYLATLARETPSAANAATYANIVREKAVRRGLIKASSEIQDAAYDTEQTELPELLEMSEQKIFQISDQRRQSDKGFRTVKTVLQSVIDRMEILTNLDGSITGVSTGYTDLDLMTSGLQPSDLIIVAGRPSMGKTAFSMNIAENVAVRGNLPVAVFSMEMPAEQLTLRMLSSLGRIDQTRVRNAKLEDDEWPRLTSSISILAETRLLIDDTPGLSPSEMRARCRRLVREHGPLGLVVVDYLQLMQVPGTSNRVEQISEISRSLKGLAKELNVPVIALSQLNRSLEQRPSKRPVMSDLRESGAIEQDADIIMFLYRDEVYNPETPDRGIAEVIIGKQRNGPIGTVRLTFLGQYTRFENFVSDPYADESY